MSAPDLNVKRHTDGTFSVRLPRQAWDDVYDALVSQHLRWSDKAREAEGSGNPSFNPGPSAYSDLANALLDKLYPRG